MKIHILGIAGTMTTPLAVALKQQGHTISGSDQEKIYPPISTMLENANISINTTSIDTTLDLAIIGSSFSSFARCKQEYETIKKLNIPYISATQYLANHLIKENSILVAGSYGKTTITALLSWIYNYCSIDTNYFFGGILAAPNFPSLKFSHSSWSITEADESINGLDTKAKFLYYPVKYLILTSAGWEHKESYDTAKKNHEAFKQLIKNIPKDGALIYNPHDPDIIPLLPFCQGAIIPYSDKTDFSTKLPGAYNQQNIQAAYTLCAYLGLDQTKVIKAISIYPGIKRRLELISDTKSLKVFDDFAQSDRRVKSAIEAVKYSYPNHRLIVYFEPHASFLENEKSIIGFKQSFATADLVILGKLKYSPSTDKLHRSTAQTWRLEIGSKLIYLPLDQSISEYLLKNTTPDDIIIHFSSGGLDGLQNLHSIVNSLNKVYNHKQL